MISGKTQLLGLIGDPVSHSISPIMHNAALQEMGLDLCYITLQSKSNNLSTVIKTLEYLNFQGLNVTIPHKENVVSLCSSLSPIAKRLQAVNTLKPDKKGGWIGSNTDVEGFISPLKDFPLERKKALVIGCGGSARAVVAGLQELQFLEITIIGRNSISLKKFLKDMNCNHAKYANTTLNGLLSNETLIAKKIKESDLIVNATPVGMHNHLEVHSSSNKVPLGKEIWNHLESKTWLYDLIYNPRPTAWLRTGEKHGCKSIDGLQMLVSQGAASLRIWCNKKIIPIQTMEKAAIGALR